MMISPVTFINELKNEPYLVLIQKRESLLEQIHQFEQDEMRGDRSSPDWHWCPNPEVRYQVNLEYLAGLSALMRERYNQEYVFGRRTLKDDAEGED